MSNLLVNLKSTKQEGKDIMFGRWFSGSSKLGAAIALASLLLLSSAGTSAFAASRSGNGTPYVTECTRFITTDKGGQSVNGGNYTLTVWVEFLYDAYFSHGLCYTRSKATIAESGNLYAGTLHLYLSNCSGNVDTVAPSVPGGGGSYTYYGSEVYAGCGETTANFKADNGYWLPGQYYYADTGSQNG